jgi:Na+-translocating ferredoxin:NAD+ oxidoreductase subunit B
MGIDVTRLQVVRRFAGPPPPRPVEVRRLRPADFPGVDADQLAMAVHLSSPLLLGPPLCAELVAFAQHVFPPEEAALARHLKPLRAVPAREVARATHRPLEEVVAVLDRAARGRRTLHGEGRGERRAYRLIPIMPGMFEIIMTGQAPDALDAWHRGFLERMDALYQTGYLSQYWKKRAGVIRYLPVGRLALTHPLALPSDQLEVVAERYRDFAVGHCQCRMSAKVAGRGCDKPSLVCSAMGDWARGAVKLGMQSISRQAYLELKREAEAHGLVTFIMNVEGLSGQASCSCCGCCCYVMRMVSEYDVPAGIAAPHFQPELERGKCTWCGACARTCPMGALVVDTQAKSGYALPHRCIGCGLCATACRRAAIRMSPVPDYRLPPDSWFAMLTRSARGLAGNALGVYLDRLLGR